MHRIAMIGLSVVLVATIAPRSLAIPPTSRPAPATRPAPTSRPIPASRPARVDDVLRPAINVLQREAQDALRKRDPLPRTDSNYFADKHVEVDPAELIKTLDRRINQDPRVDAYVKWQLLSAISKFDPSLTKPAIGAYVDASPMLPLPGLTDQERERWVNLADNARSRDACDQLTQQWADTLKPYVDANAGIIAYRDALRAHITPSEDDRPRLLQASVEDLSQRAAAGLDTDDAFTALSGEIRAWSTLAKRGAIVDMINFLREYARRQGPTINDKLVWYSNRSKGTWRTRHAQLDDKKLSTLIEALTTQGQTAPQ